MSKITNDREASEWISRSISGDLSSAEQLELEAYLSRHTHGSVGGSSAFATLSTMIEKSAAWAGAEFSRYDPEREMTNPGKIDGQSEGLSQVAKERLRNAVRKAQAQKMELDAAQARPFLKVGEKTEHYSRADEDRPESRHAVCRFTLIKKIGEGGLGTVWLARDERLRRNVAIKEMTAQAAQSPKLWKRFTREAEITGHLEHPNVVPLYMSGVNPDTGRPFYAMRFLGKQTLAQAIQEYHAKIAARVDEAIDLHRLLNVFLNVCQAIAYAHSRGVIHRDLKPENVVLDSFGQVIVLDWGLAKMESEGELALRLTLSGDVDDLLVGQTLDGDVVGTPLYMSPEQAAGDLDRMDARTDVYGLGAILFAILTGSAPHENSHKSADGTLRIKEFLDGIASRETPRPRDVNASIPRDLESICMRAMAREPFARHATALELASEVERWIAGKHERETRYDAMRMAGHELKSRLCVQVGQLSASALFVGELPPIQGMIQAMEKDPAELGSWRERLSQILVALTKSKPNVSAYSYSRFANDRVTELVRVERSVRDGANVRSVPQSRLRVSEANAFHRLAIGQFPGEASVDLDCTAAGTVRLICGVTVFDCQTEEPFGLIVAEAEIGNLVKPELSVMGFSEEVYLTDAAGHLLFQSGKSPPVMVHSAEEVFPNWSVIQVALAESPEYLDPDRDAFATRISFPQESNSIHIILKYKT